MRRRAVIAVAVGLMSLAACGSDPGVNVEADGTTTTSSTTTSPPIRASQPHCEPKPTQPYNPDAPGEQAALQGDVDAIRAYGAEHPDEFTSAGFENYPTVRAAAWFTGHLEEHRAALTSRLPHPDKLAVLQGLLSARDSESMQHAFERDSHLQGVTRAITYGTSDGVVSVDFIAARAGRDGAEYAREKWGDKLCISIASHPYPKDAWTDTPTCYPDGEATRLNRDVDVKFTLSKGTVRRGESGSGTARVTNKSDKPIEYTTGGSGFGSEVVIPKTGEPVGVETGAKTAMARIWKADPGQTIEVPVTFGTEDCRPNGNYALPTGTYEVRIGGSGNLPPASATLTIVDE